MSAQPTVRFITPWRDNVHEDPDAKPFLALQEGGSHCSNCGRLHPYDMSLFVLGEPQESGLFSSFEDARDRAEEWLPRDDGHWYARREGREGAAPEDYRFLDRQSALAWLFMIEPPL